EPVAAAIDRASWPAVFDRARMPFYETGDGIDETAQPRFGIVGIVRVPIAGRTNRMLPHAEHRAIGQNNLQLFHMMPRRAVARPMTAAGVDRNHAAHR